MPEPEIPPGGGGDPHILPFGPSPSYVGTPFVFDGVDGKHYNLFTHPASDLALVGKIVAVPGDPEDRTFFGQLQITIGDVVITIPTDGRIQIASPDYDLAIHALICSLPQHDPDVEGFVDLMGGAHYLNYAVNRFPDPRTGATGIMVDGTSGSDPEDYEVEPNEPDGPP